MAIKVFFADDHQLMVDGFRTRVKDDYDVIDVIEVAYRLDDLAKRFLESRADVLLIDVRFDRNESTTDGLDICAQILAKDSAAKIVVFSQFDEEYVIDNAYKIGVLAFVRKDEDMDILVQAIQSAYQGKEFFSPVVAQKIAWATHKSQSPIRLLEEKELKVFTLLADGASLAAVAKEMNVSYKTVGNIVKNVKQKLEIESFADFTKLAIKFGLTNLDPKTKS